MKAVLAVVVSLWLAACAARAAGPPQIVVDRSACSYCGMLISERAYAAASRTPAGGERVFDDIACLLAAMAAGDLDDASFWFHDASTGRPIAGLATVFVSAPSIRAPMGGSVMAYGERAAADRAAAQYGGSVLTSLESLIARKAHGHE
jgi:copper chaperone NosL